MKIRLGFISNSSSCSFIVVVDQTPAETDLKLKAIIEFHNILKKDNIKFEDTFHPSFIAKGDFAKKYELYTQDDGEVGVVEGKTIIYPKVEDNALPFMCDLISEYTPAVYIRKDEGIEEWL